MIANGTVKIQCGAYVDVVSIRRITPYIQRDPSIDSICVLILKFHGGGYPMLNYRFYLFKFYSS